MATMTTTVNSMMTPPEDFLTARSDEADLEIRTIREINQLKAQARALQIQQARMINRRQQGVGVLEDRLLALYYRIDALQASLGAL